MEQVRPGCTKHGQANDSAPLGGQARMLNSRQTCHPSILPPPCWHPRCVWQGRCAPDTSFLSFTWMTLPSPSTSSLMGCRREAGVSHMLGPR